MQNFIKEGKTITLTAPYNVNSGGGMLVGSIFAVATNTALSGTVTEGRVQGVFSLAKNSAEAWTVGELLYWDDTNKVVTGTSTGHKLIGVAYAVAANPSSTGYVRLNGAFIS